MLGYIYIFKVINKFEALVYFFTIMIMENCKSTEQKQEYMYIYINSLFLYQMKCLLIHRSILYVHMYTIIQNFSWLNILINFIVKLLFQLFKSQLNKRLPH